MEEQKVLAKLPSLDKGYVAYVDSSNNSDSINSLKSELLIHAQTNFSSIGTLTLLFRCPLFIQLNLSRYSLQIINTNIDDLDAYIPNQGEIGAKDAEVSRLIAEDIAHTTNALLINPAAYVADGCDPFMSQVMCPVSTYTTIIVHGSLFEWRKYVSQVRAPAPIQSYMDLVQQIIDMEWK